MLRAVLSVGLSLALVTQAGSVQGQPWPAVKDRDVANGIRQAQDGDYEAAILTLDAAANRLAAAGGQVADLTQAYVYLGIAYLAKNLQTAAQARFRDALVQTPSLRLSPDEFPPRVVELFEQARLEAGRAAAPLPISTPTPAPAPAVTSKRGGSRTILLLGAGVAAAGGIAVAAFAGGGGNEPPGGPRRTETFPGTLAPNGDDHFNITSRNGILEATLRTTEGRARPRLSVTRGSTGGELLVQQTAGPLAQVSVTVIAGTYVLHVQNSGDPVPMPYTLTVIYP